MLHGCQRPCILCNIARYVATCCRSPQVDDLISHLRAQLLHVEQEKELLSVKLEQAMAEKQKAQQQVGQHREGFMQSWKSPYQSEEHCMPWSDYCIITISFLSLDLCSVSNANRAYITSSRWHFYCLSLVCYWRLLNRLSCRLQASELHQQLARAAAENRALVALQETSDSQLKAAQVGHAIVMSRLA